MKTVVIIGGGVAGAELARCLSKCSAKGFEIYLIEPKTRIEIQALYPEYLVGKVDIDDFTAPLKPFCDKIGATLINSNALELWEGTVVCTSERVDFDLLVIATGAIQHYFGVKGSELTFSVNTLKEVIKAQKFLETKKPERIVIVGSGLTGIETACELETSLDCSVYMVEMMDRVAPMLPTTVSEKVEHCIKTRGVESLTSKTVYEVKEDRVIFNDSTSLGCDMVIWTAGIKPTRFVENIPLPKKNGWILTDRYLRAQRSEKIFSIGDNTWIELDGKLATKTGIEAERQAKHTAKNIGRLMTRKPLKPYSMMARADKPIALISTGNNCAIGVYDNRCLPFPPKLIYHLKKQIDKSIVERYK